MRFSTLELDGSSRRVNKQLQKRLVASGCYEMRGKVVFAIPLAKRSPAVRNNPAFRYVPEKLPPVDLPGVVFQEPQSPTWKEQHRMVNLGWLRGPFVPDASPELSPVQL